MSWRLRRQLIYLSILLAFLFLIAFAFYSVFQKPSCFDGKQNQGEEGVDCGGPCQISCEVKKLLPVKTEVLSAIIYPDQSLDLVGLIQNPNRDWALKDVLTVFYLYDKSNRLQNKVTVGKVSVLPREVRYVVAINLSKPNYPIGKIELKAFYDLTNWQKVAFASLPLSLVNPRIENNLFLAEISNPTENYFENLELIVRFFDSDGNLVGLSRSMIKKILPFETIPISLTLPLINNISDFQTSLHLITL